MSPSGIPDSPERQGARFEQTFAELLARLLRDDLGLRIVEIRPQARGQQGGRDIEVEWRSEDGRRRYWHFECKSQREGVISHKDVADKILQEALAPHDIDVWCLAASDCEPSNGANDLFEAAPSTLALDFAVTAISPRRQGLKMLYSCHPDLYREQYGGSPLSMTKRERQRCIERFEEWLEEWSDRRPRGGPAGWTHLTPGRVELPVGSRREAAAYLRGLTPTCPWQAIVHGWSVPRTEIEDRLIEQFEATEAGFDHAWLISAGGEGKSTVLRRVAWRLLKTMPDVQIHWADEEAAASLPAAWLAGLPDGTRVLMCVDGTGQFSGLNEGRGISAQLAQKNVAVFVLLADRGNLWHRRQSRQQLPARARKAPVKLPPMVPAERDTLVDTMEAHKLLAGSRRDQAAEMLTHAASNALSDSRANRWETSWLVPTVMELLDPLERPFERILGSVLEELLDEEHDDALKLMLAISLLHASDSALPLDLAERLVTSRAELERSIDILDQELERQLDFAGTMAGKTRLVTHGTAVSHGFVRAALSRDDLFRRLLAVCGDIPGLMRPEYTRSDALRGDRFEILDQLARYLDRRGVRGELAVTLLEAWVDLDPCGFPALHRLGSSYLHWIREELRAGGMSDGEVLALATRSRSAFERSGAVAEAVLTGHKIPTPYRRYDPGETRRFAYNSWADLEATLGAERDRHLGGRAALIRSVFLAVLSLEFENREREAVSIGLLARVLLTLEEFELAAPIAAYGIGLQTNHRIAEDLSAKFAAGTVQMPEGSLEGFAAGLATVVSDLLVPNWDALELGATRPETALIDALTRLDREWGNKATIEIPRPLTANAVDRADA